MPDAEDTAPPESTAPAEHGMPPDDGCSSSTRSPLAPPAAFAWRPVLALALGLLAVLLAVADRYGPHRDELYFVAAGRRLAWGYPDQPPLTPLLARLADVVAPGSLVVLHAVPAVMAAALVVVAGLTARELGTGRPAQVLTAVAVATGAITAVVGHMLSTAGTDLLLSATLVWLVLRTLRRDAPRSWLLVGVLAGVALQNKHLVAFLLAAVVLGIALTPAVRPHLRSPWAWAGALLALTMWAPNLAWQAAHGWPQLTLAADIRDEYGTLGERAGFVLLLLVLLSPVATWVAVRGTVRLWRAPELRFARPVAIAAVTLVLLYAVTGGKAYYLAGLLPALVAAGAEEIVGRSTDAEVRRTGVVLALAGMVAWPAALPLLPPHVYGGSVLHDVIDDGGEMIGWPELVATVQEAVGSSGAELVITSNYGIAGALEWYGPDAALGVPVHSGHNGYGDWGPPPDSLTGPVVLVGYAAPPPWARDCLAVAEVRNDAGVDNEENGTPVLACEGTTAAWSVIWPQVRHLSA